MNELPSTSEREQFKVAVKRLVELHQELKELGRQAKEKRSSLQALKAVVIAFMEGADLDVCNVNHNGKSGELALRTSKRKKGVRKEDAIAQIEKYLQQEMQVDEAAQRATLIWDGIQEGRATSEVRDLSVRKF
tara:strand:- start:2047 stop:2445 length:399 start_codon:yes stop_codon:yes gene_type:complete